MNRTVYLSGASIFSTAPSIERFGLPLIDRNRSYVYFTSAAVSSRPFTGGLGCQRTPFLSLKTYVVSFCCAHDSARSDSIGYVIGFTEGPAFTLTSRLYTNESGTIVTNEIVWWGSKCRGSAWNVRRSTPPFFGVCASAGRGARPSCAAPSASAAPPTLRASRRESS